MLSFELLTKIPNFNIIFRSKKSFFERFLQENLKLLEQFPANVNVVHLEAAKICFNSTLFSSWFRKLL